MIYGKCCATTRVPMSTTSMSVPQKPEVPITLL